MYDLRWESLAFSLLETRKKDGVLEFENKEKDKYCATWQLALGTVYRVFVEAEAEQSRAELRADRPAIHSQSQLGLLHFEF